MLIYKPHCTASQKALWSAAANPLYKVNSANTCSALSMPLLELHMCHSSNTPQSRHTEAGKHIYVTRLERVSLSLQIMWASADKGGYRQISWAITEGISRNSRANYQPQLVHGSAASDNKAFKDISSFNNFWMTPWGIWLIQTLS